MGLHYAHKEGGQGELPSLDGRLLGVVTAAGLAQVATIWQDGTLTRDHLNSAFTVMFEQYPQADTPLVAVGRHARRVAGAPIRHPGDRRAILSHGDGPSRHHVMQSTTEV